MIDQIENKHIIYSDINKSNYFPRLLRASSIFENAKKKLIFINPSRRIKEEIEENEEKEEIEEKSSFENSFLFVDRLNRYKSNEKSREIINISTSFISLDKLLPTKKESFRFFNEDDLFFEEILRSKLVEKLISEFSLQNLKHLDLLKIPFPKDINFLWNRNYFDDFVEELKYKYKDKFLIEEIHIKFYKTDYLISFINNKSNINIIGEVKENIFDFDYNNNNNKKFVGINMKKYHNDIYCISYLFSLEK
jgi:hypothetical protein